MNKIIKSLAAAAAIASAGSAFAGPTIGGLTIPGTGGVLKVASIYENVVTAVGQTLRGVGEINEINGQNITTLCAGCELTYRFDNFLVTSLSPTNITFSGGTLMFYLGFGADNDFSPFTSAGSAADLAAATNGTLFLTLRGHPVDALGNTFIGTGVNIGLPSAAGSGSGLADVVAGGGIASAFFDTNSIVAAFGGPADFQVGSSFSNVFIPHPAECVGAAPAGPECLAGSADFRGLAVNIPEPSSIALVGLALLGVGASTKKRRSV